jgi:hypothetical protein
VTKDDFANLPKNAFGEWMQAKQPNLSGFLTAADQLTVLSVALPNFATRPQPSIADTSGGFSSHKGQGPPLVPNANGNAWLDTEIQTSLVRSSLWRMLQAPQTWGL